MHPVKIRLRRACAGLLLPLIAIVALPLQAHDFWLSAHRATPAAAPSLRLWVGHHLAAEESRGYTAASNYRLRLARPGTGMLDLSALGREGSDPFLTLPASTRAPTLVALDRHAVDIALPGSQFDGYLEEEHLPQILALRKAAAKGGAAIEGRERYTRHIKVLVGDGGKERLHARRTGQALEIVLLDAPGKPAAGRTLRAQVLFAGKPLPDRTLTIVDDADGRFDNDNARARTAVTDDQGIATFAYDRPGFWLLRMVHMLPCTEACGDADWRSYWAAYALQPDWLPPQGK